jgi:hypothetical protein
MTAIKLFPPQVLSDLNFLSVNSKEELASRLRAVQRVVAAAIGAYLMVRYQPILGASCAVQTAVYLASIAGYACLSLPALSLVASGFVATHETLGAASHSRNKELGWTVINVAWIGMAYFLSQGYRHAAFEIGPNFLERVFQKVEDKLTQPLWDRFYK